MIHHYEQDVLIDEHMNLPKRKSNRLPGYDYSSCGAYFVTICTKNRNNLFWHPIGATLDRPNENPLSKIGEIINAETIKLNTIYPNIVVDKFVIMPNHIHMIILILSDEIGRPQEAPAISRVIQQFKGKITKQTGFSPWQKSFHDHIIRDEHDYEEIWQYIDENPLKWEQDCFFIE